MIPPWIAARPWISDASRILDDRPVLIADDQSSVVFFNEIGNVDDAPTPLLHEFHLARLEPFHAG